MIVEMEIQVKFNRPVDLEKDYIVPGGYSMTMDGKDVEFDFCQSSSGISNEDSSVVIFSVTDMDYASFPGLKKLRIKDLKNISSISECFVYTGEPGESDLEVESIKKILFILPHTKPWVIDVPEKLIIMQRCPLPLSERTRVTAGLRNGLLPGYPRVPRKAPRSRSAASGES